MSLKIYFVLIKNDVTFANTKKLNFELFVGNSK